MDKAIISGIVVGTFQTNEMRQFESSSTFSDFALSYRNTRKEMLAVH